MYIMYVMQAGFISLPFIIFNQVFQYYSFLKLSFLMFIYIIIIYFLISYILYISSISRINKLFNPGWLVSSFIIRPVNVRIQGSISLTSNTCVVYVKVFVPVCETLPPLPSLYSLLSTNGSFSVSIYNSSRRLCICRFVLFWNDTPHALPWLSESCFLALS